jgi:Arc/MetJ-type ribon-helix-helix transcriptional regulator
MATRKITITLPEELVESIRGRVEARGVAAYITAAAAHQDAMDRLRELADQLEQEHGPVLEEDEQAALERSAAFDAWHDQRRSRPGAAA